MILVTGATGNNGGEIVKQRGKFCNWLPSIYGGLTTGKTWA